MRQPLHIEIGLTFLTNDGQPVVICQRRETGRTIPGTDLADVRFMGRSQQDPRLMIEFDRDGRALEFWRAHLPASVPVKKKHPAIRRLNSDERQPAPETFSLARLKARPRREQVREAWHRWAAKPENRERKRAADRARYQARKAQQQTKGHPTK
ncbi:hypothetical protein [Salinarimonas sp.]|uniref:hypothetical protein n=1 Tax=Salinarimonas sp. TaxID=2766526 RepID=UPI003918B5F4